MYISRHLLITIALTAVLLLGLNAMVWGELIWDKDTQSYIERPAYEAAPPIIPAFDNAELLWDDTHDTDGDDLYVNYSNLAGMFPNWGVNATQIQTGPLTAALLANYDILVLIDNEGAYTGQEISDIQNWINSGGALLMIGENWSAFNPTQNNLIIAPYGIQFQNTATSGASNFAPHPITNGLTQLSWAAGSSLTVSGVAVPLAWDASNNNGLAVNESGVKVVVLDDSNMMDNTNLNTASNALCMENVMNFLGITYFLFDVDITLTPVNPPIQIPAGGGNFEFDVEIANNDSITGYFDAWTYAVLPTGGQTNNLIQKTGLQLAPGVSIIRPGMTQYIPARTPIGTYTYVANVGEMMSIEIFAIDSFDFEKLAFDDGTSYQGSWEMCGWDSEAPIECTSGIKSDLRISGANPFNPETSLNFRIAESGNISLQVYDVQGRLAADLVDGYTPAGNYTVKFYARDLSSGIYFARLQAGNEVSTQKLMLVK